MMTRYLGFVLAVLSVAAYACGEGSDSSGPMTGGSGGSTAGTGGETAGTGGATGGTGGATGGTGGSTGGTGGEGGVGAEGGVGGPPPGGVGGGDPNDCGMSQGTSGTRIIVDITWPGTIGVEAGAGQLVVWARAKLVGSGEPNPDGTYPVEGETVGCGTLLPPLVKSALSGGGLVGVTVPDATFDSPSMPVGTARGTVSNRGPEADITMETTSNVVGMTLADPINAVWPDVAACRAAAEDHDGDGKPGITTIPRGDGDFVLPPAVDNILAAVDPNGPKADQLYTVARVTMQLQGKRTSCESASGSATVKHFDNHVIGCHVLGGADCTEAVSNFIDEQRALYEIGAATYEMIKVADDATCADVRAALPPPP